jgi:hypothetical protein
MVSRPKCSFPRNGAPRSNGRPPARPARSPPSSPSPRSRCPRAPPPPNPVTEIAHPARPPRRSCRGSTPRTACRRPARCRDSGRMGPPRRSRPSGGQRAVPGRRARRPGLAAAAARKLGRDRTDVHRNRAPHRALLAKRETGSLLDTLRVDALFTDAAGYDNVLPSGIILGSGHWVPTAPLVIGVNTLALSGDPLQVSFRFVPLNGSRWPWTTSTSTRTAPTDAVAHRSSPPARCVTDGLPRRRTW